MSRSTDVPPMSKCALSDVIEVNEVNTEWICCASSLVGAKMIAWWVFSSALHRMIVPMLKAPVLPVPDWAWARMSLPWIIGKIDCCWIGLGLSNPIE